MTKRVSDGSTLDELEGVEWGPPAYDSYLVSTCHRLRRKPLAEFTVEDLRIMIGQAIGLSFLIPIALEVVEREPLAQGDYYPGDLLKSLLGVDVAFWRGEAKWADRLRAVLRRIPDVPKELGEAITAFEGACGPTMG